MALTRLAPLAAVAISGTALAGIFGTPPEFISMQVGRGYVDLLDPFGAGSNTATITSPPVGSFLLLGGGIPGVERFLSVLEFTSAETTAAGHVATFSFRNELDVHPFAGSPSEFAFAGNRLAFSTAGAATFTFHGPLGVSGGGALFVYDYARPQDILIVDESYASVEVTLVLGAGSHTIAWGVLSNPDGGTGDWEGTATLVAVPAPGAATVLLAVAGVTVGRRRRR